MSTHIIEVLNELRIRSEALPIRCEAIPSIHNGNISVQK